MATKYKDDYTIGINIGTFFMLEDMFYKMMATHNVLEEVDSVSTKTSEKNH